MSLSKTFYEHVVDIPKKEYVEATSEGIKQSANRPLYEVVIEKVKNLFNIK